MRRFTRVRIAAFALLSLTAAAIVSVVALGGSTTREPDHYPDPPFAPVPAEFPRVILVKECPPAREVSAYNAWHQERREVRRYLAEGGAMSRATPQERKALAAVTDEKYREARTLAEEVLRSDPQSLSARYVLATVQYKAEENFPRALNLFRGLRRICEARGQANPDDADAREWYIRTLDREISVLSSMDRTEEELKAVACLEKVYQPLPWLKVWPLMKLKREAEARAASEAAIQAGMPRLATNGLAALESKFLYREAAVKLFTRLTEIDPDSAVAWSNLGKSLRSLYRHDEAEKAFLRSTAARQDFSSSAFNSLALLYLSQSRFTEAADALRKAQEQRARRKSHTLVQDEASTQRNIARLRLALGLPEDALRTARRAFDFQDRTGSTSASEHDLFLTAGTLLYDTLTCRIAELAELPAGSPEGYAERRMLELDRWSLRQKMTALLDAERLEEALKPGYDIEDYLDLLPPGVALAAVRKARDAAPELRAAGEEVYLDAMEARGLYRLGRYAETRSLARRALDHLPVVERLRRAELSAIAGDAAAREGDLAEAFKLWEVTLRDHPVSFRLLDIRLPVTIASDGGPAASAAAELLKGSTRFREVKGGYSIRVSVREGAVRVEMFGPNDVLLREASVAVKDSVEETARNAAREFLMRLHQPQVDLTQLNLGSLDGSPTATADAATVDRILESAGK